MNKNKWAKYQPLVWFVVTLLLGVLLLIIAEYWLDGRAREITIGVGVSFITAAIIGGVIELAFVTRLAQNVFEVAFGYILRKEISEEIKWIYGMTRLVTNYRHDIVIERCGNNPSMVFMHETISRTCKNIGNKDEPIEPSLGIQEWFHSERRSEITSYKLTHDGKEFSLENKKVKVGRPSKNKQSDYMGHLARN